MLAEIRLDLEKCIICGSGFAHNQSDEHFSKVGKLHEVIKPNNTKKQKKSLEGKLACLCGKGTSEYTVP